MATMNQCIASLSRLGLSAIARPTVTTVAPTLPRYLAPSASASVPVIQARAASGTVGMQARQREKEKAKKKRKQQRHKEYKYATPSREEQYSLCDAMRYVGNINCPVTYGPTYGVLSCSV